MALQLENRNDNSKFPTNIFTHVTVNNNVHLGKITDLTCYSAKIKMNEQVPLQHSLTLKFIYKMEYKVEAEIIEKLTDSEYRVKFIFNDFKQNEMLKRDIHRDSRVDCKGLWCRN